MTFSVLNASILEVWLGFSLVHGGFKVELAESVNISYFYMFLGVGSSGRLPHGAAHGCAG